jgi:cytoskeletal protein CcmA (bactofilin family)
MISNKKRTAENLKVETIFGKDTHFKGTIEAGNGSIRIDGDFEGQIYLGGDLIVSETANVTGSIVAKNLLVSGQVQGNIEVRGKLELTPSAKVFADAKMMLFVVEDGATIQGNCESMSREGLLERGKTRTAPENQENQKSVESQNI